MHKVGVLTQEERAYDKPVEPVSKSDCLIKLFDIVTGGNARGDAFSVRYCGKCNGSGDACQSGNYRPFRSATQRELEYLMQKRREAGELDAETVLYQRSSIVDPSLIDTVIMHGDDILKESSLQDAVDSGVPEIEAIMRNRRCWQIPKGRFPVARPEDIARPGFKNSSNYIELG